MIIRINLGISHGKRERELRIQKEKISKYALSIVKFRYIIQLSAFRNLKVFKIISRLKF